MRRSILFACILGFVGFVTSFGAYIVAVNLPTYAKEVGVGLAFIGVLIAAYDFAELVAKPIFGGLADKQGMKKTMLAGILLFTFASLLYLVIPAKLLILVRFAQGVGAAALSAVSLALVGVYYKENRGRAYGIYNAIKGANYVLSPIIGGAIVLRSHFGAIFYACAAIGVVAFLISLMLPDPKEKVDEVFDDDDFSLSGFKAIFADSRLWPWFTVIVVNMFFVGILFGFLPVRVSELGFDPFKSGLLLSVTTISYLLIQPVAGFFADKVSPAKTVKFSLLLSGIATILIPFVTGVPLILVSIIAGVGIGTVWTNTDTLVSTLAQEGDLGATMGVAGSFKEFGDMIGPLLMGLISQTFGLKYGFVLCGILGVLSLIIINRKSATTNY